MSREICLGHDPLESIKHLLFGKAYDSRKTAADGKLLTDAVVWIAKTGEFWRGFLKHRGRDSVFRKHNGCGPRLEEGKLDRSYSDATAPWPSPLP